MGSPGMPARAQEQDPPSSAKAPATLQPCPQITAGPAGRALQSSPWKVIPVSIPFIHIQPRARGSHAAAS